MKSDLHKLNKGENAKGGKVFGKEASLNLADVWVTFKGMSE